MGVKRAVQIAMDTSSRSVSGSVFTCGPLIHNPQVVERLSQSGIVIEPDPDSLKSGTVIIRAHGMPKDQVTRMMEADLEVVDATCPHVVASQKRIVSHHEKGKTVIIVGDPGHPEILSLQSFAPDRHLIISNIAQARTLSVAGPCMVIAQTTFNEKEYSEITAVLKQRVPELEVYQSICRATSSRQEEITSLSREADAVVVVGGRSSANTRRLAEIARNQNKPVFLIETASELVHEDFDPSWTVAVTAGASTPDWLTDEVISLLKSLG